MAWDKCCPCTNDPSGRKETLSQNLNQTIIGPPNESLINSASLSKSEKIPPDSQKCRTKTLRKIHHHKHPCKNHSTPPHPPMYLHLPSSPFPQVFLPFFPYSLSWSIHRSSIVPILFDSKMEVVSYMGSRYVYETNYYISATLFRDWELATITCPDRSYRYHCTVSSVIRRGLAPLLAPSPALSARRRPGGNIQLRVLGLWCQSWYLWSPVPAVCMHTH